MQHRSTIRPGTSAIIVLGDSYVENLMNEYSESLQGGLPNLLKRSEPVLNFGTSGGNLAHDLGVAGLVGKLFSPTAAVIVITRGSFTGGFNSSPGYFHWVSGVPAAVALVPERHHGRLIQFVRQLALVRYARANLRADLGQLLEPRGRGLKAGCVPVSLSVADEALIDFTLTDLPERLRLPPSEIVLVFDADRERIYKPDAPPACQTRDALGLRLLAQRATTNGFAVIDMDPILRAVFLRTGEHFDYSPVDGHWNSVAHHLAAEAVARYFDAHPDTESTETLR